MTFNPADHPHRRYNPLTGDYVLVSPHRMKRPWQGKVETPTPDNRPQYDEKCYLCPGNERANGEHNPHYTNTYVFTNDFAALLSEPHPPTPSPLRREGESISSDASSDSPRPLGEGQGVRANFLNAEPVRGTCRVICFSPRHDLTLPRMSHAEIRQVVEMWSEQISELGQQYRWVQVFETKGDIMGTSNSHPHGQIWASDFLPNEARKEDAHQRAYYEKNRSSLLLDYLNSELEQQERIVVANDTWVALVPFWAYWPFEVMILPRRAVRHVPDLNDTERAGLADILKRMLTKYDNLFGVSFPYGSGWHGAPFDGEDNAHWQLHMHYYPPLLRSATVKKFVASYELLAEAQRDLTPEQAAARLRDQSEVHYQDV